MKKIVLLVTVLIGLSIFLHAQISFPTSNAIWNECVEINTIKYEMRYGLLGDTLINDTLYSKMYQFADTILSEEYIYSSGYIDGYIGAFRNEEQKVFFKPAYWSYSDILLYDFGAEVGDTVWHYVDNNLFIHDYYNIVSNSGESYSIITSITTENGRKIYQVDNASQYTYEWYEGIGSNSGVLRSLETAVPTDGNSYDYYLLCFKHNGNVEHLSNPICNVCFCPLFDVKENSYSELINIYPNPTKDILNIELPEDMKVKTMTIYSIDGKFIEEITYSFYSGQLDVSNLKAGSYTLNIETDKGSFNKLIIKK
ncbi:MAG: T9SS type A sorting domain-containing protein [Bacteroidales bacterium]|jgi:hypothetical protein|nr:T9SS type A sorting domain-containing protein [Bacteroidales bacterium]